MGRLKAYSAIIVLFLCSMEMMGQFQLTGTIMDGELLTPIPDTEVYIRELNLLERTNASGKFHFSAIRKGEYQVVFFVMGYNVLEKTIQISENTEVAVNLEPLSSELPEVIISQKREEVFNLKRLNPIEGTAIYAGKKSEVVLVEQMVGNLAANNPRQIYGQVVGLNIYENNDGGLQLNIGGRGLDPNRTSNFNTRQNGYDISADALGYPESYYSPPVEALREIQVVRGAASLQYGTQFGGLINFKFKKPNPVKPIEWVSRQSYGSFNLFTSFNSLSGTVGKVSYYTYFNYKRGDGYRPNSGFDSKNFYGAIYYNVSDKTRLTFETTYLGYLAQQPGGLTDTQFNQDPTFSNRERNWFEVDWKLFAATLEHEITDNTDLSIKLFGLNASRNALGFRGDPTRPERNPITEMDDTTAFTRDLIKGEFNNWGTEARLLSRYKMGSRDGVFLIGTRYYQSDNYSVQGPGTNKMGPDFSFAHDEFPSYPYQSDFHFPNTNVAIFGENIFFINDRLSITPGFRFEHINTKSEGEYIVVTHNLAGNPINRIDTTDNRSLIRSFMLFGVGASYYTPKNVELYANVSQNYRSVTFSDIRVVNPTFLIDPNISDERGFTADFGLRGKWNKRLSYDIGAYGLMYNDRIGTLLVETGPNKGDRMRKNIGDAFIYGIETFVDWNIAGSVGMNTENWKLNLFTNLAITESEYISSEENNVKGKKVEFIPFFNLKTGLNFGYRNLMGNLQFTNLSKQFTDAENSEIPAEGDAREGIIGEVPAYHIMDFSLSYRYKKVKVEAGVNNLLNNSYFTRRATGYPGPGIIPAEPRTFYTTLEFRIN